MNLQDHSGVLRDDDYVEVLNLVTFAAELKLQC